MDFKEVLSFLEKGLNLPLPGKDAQMLMSPRPVDMRRFDPPMTVNQRKGAVLILFYPENHHAFFPLIKRPVYQGIHSGQIALPGGKMESGDVDVIQTALREASEEVGIYPEKVRVLGQISDLYIPASNFLVSPILGFCESKPTFVPEIREVEQIISTALSDLFIPELQKRKFLEVGPDFMIDAPYFKIDEEMVWGATAMILSEVIQLLKNGMR
jgi:8-oxo-dGTP pyrophosphatase MutT (NUDIX family)